MILNVPLGHIPVMKNLHTLIIRKKINFKKIHLFNQSIKFARNIKN